MDWHHDGLPRVSLSVTLCLEDPIWVPAACFSPMAFPPASSPLVMVTVTMAVVPVILAKVCAPQAGRHRQGLPAITS
jgi:hypothetical protein